MKCFSCNKCSFIKTAGIQEIEAGIDDGNNMAYLMFEDSQELNAVLAKYYQADTVVNLNDFLRNYKTVRQLMKEVINNRRV